jgi:hypothetical protein
MFAAARVISGDGSLPLASFLRIPYDGADMQR